MGDGGERGGIHAGELVRFIGRPSGDGIIDAAAAPLEEEGEEGEGEGEEGEEEEELSGGGGGRWLLPETRHCEKAGPGLDPRLSTLMGDGFLYFI